ncbi:MULTISPECIES: hypothetical protein [unclassified Clostridium]|uniref:hypothetical protein n=1 Tax=unclassified Clostridium TaxID=2614128 RepID=UPI00290B6FB4|nr:hypothetical protein [Clostridium sp.]MDU5106554.1 hypothetical protein [Clostridium sp.]
MINKEIQIEDMAKKALETLKCPVCNSDNFMANYNITAKFPVDRDDNQINGDISPSIEFTCLECGNIVSMNADILAKRVIESEEKETQ